MRIFLKRACAALCAVLVLAALAACGGPLDLPFLDPYEQPFVLQDGFVRYANVGYVEEFYGQGDQIFVIRSAEEMEDFCAGFPQGALAQDYDELPSLAEICTYAEQEKESFWDEYKRPDNPHVYKVDLSQKLFDIKNKLISEIRSNG